MMDRLEECKAMLTGMQSLVDPRDPLRRIHSRNQDRVAWLIAEVERLRADSPSDLQRLQADAARWDYVRTYGCDALVDQVEIEMDLRATAFDVTGKSERIDFKWRLGEDADRAVDNAS